MIKKWFFMCSLFVLANSSLLAIEWKMEKEEDIKPLNKNGTAYVDGGKDLKFMNAVFSYRHAVHHCWFKLNFAKKSLKPKSNCILTFRLFTSTPGRITLYKVLSSNQLSSLDIIINVTNGWNEYEIDLSKHSFGRWFHSKTLTEQESKSWDSGDIYGLRLDTWFQVGTEVKWDWIRLSARKSNKNIGKPAFKKQPSGKCKN